MSLEEFLSTNRSEIIRRTRARIASRSSPKTTPEELEHGVPLFLGQLSDTLKEVARHKKDDAPDRPAKTPAIADSAAEHGRVLLKYGFTIEQVVHDYGDICQAVTELAGERGDNLSIVEFQTLNRCLDDAIAGAVSSWSAGREKAARAAGAKESKGRADVKTRLLLLLDQVHGSVEAIRTGSVGLAGATGGLLRSCVIEMRALVEKGE